MGAIVSNQSHALAYECVLLVVVGNRPYITYTFNRPYGLAIQMIILPVKQISKHFLEIDYKYLKKKMFWYL